jgi:PilZ domain
MVEKPSQPANDQRRTPRFPFSAPAEIIRVDTQAAEPTRVNELSLYGCYLDTRSPLPRGSQVIVKIFSGDHFFEAAATVVYAQPSLGVGLAFRDVRPNYVAVLQMWLRQAVEKQNTRPSIENFEEDERSA